MKKYFQKIFTPQSVILFIAFLVFAWLSIDFIRQTGISNHIDIVIGRNYGGMLGGIFSFLSIVLIYLTLNRQIEVTNRATFENKFFELIKYHRDNISEWEHLNPDCENKELVKG